MKALTQLDATELDHRFRAAGLIDAIATRGFHDVDIGIRRPATGLPHITMHAWRNGIRALLLDACLTEATVRDVRLAPGADADPESVELLVAYWVREQDPTRPFVAQRPPLPLQDHPGLGVLPSAFRVLRTLARDLGKDGVAAVPKFFHDAVIFYRSRLFLFLDGTEQGRFERMLADLAPLPLAHATLALLDGHVRAGNDRPIRWAPGFQVHPISDRLTAYLNSGEYAEAVDRGVAECGYRCEPMNLLPAVLESSIANGTGRTTGEA